MRWYDMNGQFGTRFTDIGVAKQTVESLSSRRHGARSRRSFASPAELIREISDGRVVILVGGDSGTGTADLVMAADHVTPDAVNFMATHGRGLISVALTSARIDALGIARMPASEGREMDYDSGVSIEAKDGVTTGISAPDRACTIAALACSTSLESDLCSPGHVFPLIARDGGVLERSGRAEAAIDIVRLANQSPCAVLCELLASDGETLVGSELFDVAHRHGLKVGAVSELVEYRCRHDPVLRRVVDAQVANEWGGDWRRLVYRDVASGVEITALAIGNLARSCVPVLLHQAKLDTDVLGFVDADTMSLRSAIEMVSHEGTGVIIILEPSRRPTADHRPTRSRKAIHEQANERIVASQILFDLGVASPVDLRARCNRPAPLRGDQTSERRAVRYG